MALGERQGWGCDGGSVFYRTLCLRLVCINVIRRRQCGHESPDVKPGKNRTSPQ